MDTEDPAGPPVAAAGGRGAEREWAICEAALELLLEVGYDRMSMDAVASRAHASKATIYRRWPGKRELVVDAIRVQAPHDVAPADTGSLRGDIIATIRTLADRMGEHDADLLAGVLRAMRGAPEIAETLRAQMLDDKRSLFRSIVLRAVDRGELGPDTDVELLFEVAPALMFFRVLVTGGSVDDEFLAHVADDVLVPLLTRSTGNRQEKL